MTAWIGLGAAFPAAALFGYVAVAGIRRWALRRGMLDVPNERSSHVRPTPRGGGLAIVIVWLAVLLQPLGHLPLSQPRALALAGATILVAAVSWRDDMRHVPAPLRFVTHTVAAVIALLALGLPHFISVPFVGDVSVGWWGWPVGVLWIVGLTNAYNFMDGIDGIAGAQAVTAGLGWGVIGSLAGAQSLALLGAVVAGSSAGFLVHNWAPARIFMGDVGSAFLGFVLATTTLWGANQSPRLGLAGVLLVAPFIFDSVFTFVRRLARRENVLQAHRTHLYQRMVVVGLSHARVAGTYALFGAVSASAAASWFSGIGSPAWWLASVAVACVALWAGVLVSERRSQRC